MQAKDFTNRWAGNASSISNRGSARDFTRGPTKPVRSRPVKEGPKPSAMTGKFSPVIKPTARTFKIGPRR